MNLVTIHFADGRIEIVAPRPEQELQSYVQLLQAAFGESATVKGYGPGERVQIWPAP